MTITYPSSKNKARPGRPYKRHGVQAVVSRPGRAPSHYIAQLSAPQRHVISEETNQPRVECDAATHAGAIPRLSLRLRSSCFSLDPVSTATASPNPDAPGAPSATARSASDGTPDLSATARTECAAEGVGPHGSAGKSTGRGVLSAGSAPVGTRPPTSRSTTAWLCSSAAPTTTRTSGQPVMRAIGGRPAPSRPAPPLGDPLTA